MGEGARLRLGVHQQHRQQHDPEQGRSADQRAVQETRHEVGRPSEKQAERVGAAIRYGLID
ncbi:MAG: hypothetical protein RhofKO_43160 [Rhodothermales bacterium]